MKLKNVPSEISLQNLCMYLLGGFVVPVVYILGSSEVTSAIKELCFGSVRAALFTIVFHIIMLVLICNELHKYIAEKKKFNSVLNLKSVELLSDEIQFVFTNPSDNFACKYFDLKSVDIELCTALPVYPDWFVKEHIRKINVSFYLSNGKNLTVHFPRKAFATRNNYVGTVSNIIKRLKKYTDVKYHYSGRGEVARITKQLEKI